MSATVQAPIRRYRGVPADERRAARRRQLLDAALEMLGDEGYARTTVRGVCRRANLTPRYFYESFDDLETLVVTVFDEVIGATTEAMIEAVEAAPHDARAKSRAAIETFVRGLTDDPRRARVAFVEALGSERLMRRRLDTLRLCSDLVAAQARAFYEPPREADTIVDLTAAVLVGGMAELLIRWLDGSLDVSREELIDHLTELFVATGENAVTMGRGR
jgi:AcrR family transcriptional regulator